MEQRGAGGETISSSVEEADAGGLWSCSHSCVILNQVGFSKQEAVFALLSQPHVFFFPADSVALFHFLVIFIYVTLREFFFFLTLLALVVRIKKKSLKICCEFFCLIRLHEH